MNILITGHKGFIGQNMMKFMKDKGHTVKGFEYYDNNENYPDLSGVDAVIHLGAITNTTERNIDLLMQKNYDFSCHLAEDCAYLKIPFQYASSASIYGDGMNDMSETSMPQPMNYYAYSKYMFERFASTLAEQTEAVIQGFRYFNVYGPHEEHKGQMASPLTQFRKQAQRNSTIRIFEGSSNMKRDFVFVGDICELHNRMLEIKESGIWNAGTGVCTSFEEIAFMIAEKYEAEIEHIVMPEILKHQYQYYTQANLRKLNDTVKMNWFPVEDYINYEL